MKGCNCCQVSWRKLEWKNLGGNFGPSKILTSPPKKNSLKTPFRPPAPTPPPFRRLGLPYPSFEQKKNIRNVHRKMFMAISDRNHLLPYRSLLTMGKHHPSPKADNPLQLRGALQPCQRHITWSWQVFQKEFRGEHPWSSCPWCFDFP